MVKISEYDRMISKGDFVSIQKNYRLQNGDVLLTIVGSIGRVARYTKYNKPVIFQRSVAFLRGSNNIANGFLVYALQTDKIQNQLIAATSMSAQGGVYLGSVSKLIISFPIILIQTKISNLLEKFDDLIAANQRQQNDPIFFDTS